MSKLKIDAIIQPSGDLAADAAAIKKARSLGFDAIWLPEVAFNPFLALTIAFSREPSGKLGSMDAAAFPRSPMVTAQIAWDLARQSRGRFLLGLAPGTTAGREPQTDDQRDQEAARMREYIESLHAIWRAFQHDERLRYRGRHYTFRLMAPFFNPGPIAHPRIPIYLAGLEPRLCQLAGELAAGLQASPLHTMSFLQEIVLPAIEEGLRRSGRQRSEFELCLPLIIAAGGTREKAARAHADAKRQIATLLRSSDVHALLRHHGWDISSPDDLLEELAITAPAREVANNIRRRYGDIADRISFRFRDDDLALMEAILRDLRD